MISDLAEVLSAVDVNRTNGESNDGLRRAGNELKIESNYPTGGQSVADNRIPIRRDLVGTALLV
jgi:hypothetical protein